MLWTKDCLTVEILFILQATGEEVFASHGNYIDDSENKDMAYLMEGFTLNERFEEQPKQYFENKVKPAASDN